jgi:hypothetical protein
MTSYFKLEPNFGKGVEGELENLCAQGYLVHGSPHEYKRDRSEPSKVFIPQNHPIIAHKSPIHAIYHALFDRTKAKLHTHKENGYTRRYAIVSNPDARREEGVVYVFNEADFIKTEIIQETTYGRPITFTIYKRDPKKSLIDTIKIIDVKKEDFQPKVISIELKIL